MDITNVTTQLPPVDSCKVEDTNHQTTSIAPIHIIGCQNFDQLNQMPDIQKLQLREYTKQNDLQLNFDDIEEIYDTDGVETIKKIDETISNSNTDFTNIKLVWDKKKSVVRILGSASIPKYLMWEFITSNEYNKWYPYLSQKTDEDYEITFKKTQQPEDSFFKSIKNYIPGLASGTQTSYPLLNVDSVVSYSTSDNTSSTLDYVASYANTDFESIQNATTIGNQNFIPVVVTDRKLTAISPEEEWDINFSKLEYVVTFLQQNTHIKHIVDVGCGDASKSLALQKILKRAGLNVTVFPVDIIRDPKSIIPFNLLPAQNIKNADPSSTIFTAIHSFVDPLNGLKDDENYYLHTLIQNNPGCFILVTGDINFSTPNKYIPSKFIYTKKLFLSTTDSSYLELKEFKAIEKFFDRFPQERFDYLDTLKKLGSDGDINDALGLGLETFFCLYANAKLKCEGVNYIRFIMKKIKKDVQYFWWHIYQDSMS